MGNDDYWVVEYTNGDVEKFFATPRHEDNVLVMTEHYGVTGGVKQQTMIPLGVVRKWRKARSSEER